MTAVLASVQSADAAPFGLYAAAAITFVVLCGVYCVLGVVTVARLSAWRQRRNEHRSTTHSHATEGPQR